MLYLSYYNLNAIEFKGKFLQGHYIIGITDPFAEIIIDKKKVMYNHKIDKKEKKWLEGEKLETINLQELPKYIADNYKNFHNLILSHLIKYLNFSTH